MSIAAFTTSYATLFNIKIIQTAHKINLLPHKAQQKKHRATHAMLVRYFVV